MLLSPAPYRIPKRANPEIDPGADELWLQLDPALWELTHDPWVVLPTVSRDRLERVLADPAFREKVDALVQSKEHAAAAPT